MKINYALDDLRKIVRNIHKISGYTISIWDTNYCQLVYETPLMAKFCRLIKATEEGNRRCQCSDIKIISQAKEKRALCVHRCHAGLVDAAMPIIDGDQLVGYIMYGQLAEPADEKLSFPLVWECLKDLNIGQEELEDAFGRIRYIDQEGVEAIGEILTFCISYILTKNLIAVENNVLADYLSTYIDQNLMEDLSVNSLCHQFGISKNTLYKVSHDCFGTTILDYITKKRIESACMLLKEQSLPISEICDRIGISDYNYFFKLFKRHTGVSPRKYRSDIDAETTWTS